MKNAFETSLPSQSFDPEHETIVDVIIKEDVAVGKINKGEDSAERVEPKKDAERKKHDVRNPAP